MITRYAIVRGLGVSAEKVAAYLPSNYRVIWEGKTNWHYYGAKCWRQVAGREDDVVVIQGKDDHGWTLDKYVAPRLGSGLMRCDECDLSHPIMKQIPDEPSKNLPDVVGRTNPKHCPKCGGNNLMHAVEWEAYSLDPSDRGNEAKLDEYQCHDCAISFWM